MAEAVTVVTEVDAVVAEDTAEAVVEEEGDTEMAGQYFLQFSHRDSYRAEQFFNSN